MITEYFEGNTLFDFVNIESKMYNRKSIAKIIFNLLSLAKDLKSNGIKQFYFLPKNIFCNYNEHEQFKLQVFFCNDLDIDDDYIYNQTNFLYKMLFNVIKENNIQWQIGVLMLNLIYGTIPFISEQEDHKELYKELLEYIGQNPIEDISKNVLCVLLNNKELKSSIEKEYFTKSKNSSKVFNLFNEIDTEQLNTLFNSFRNYLFITKHYQIFNELSYINDRISLMSSLFDKTTSISIKDIKERLSPLLGESLISIEIEKLKEDEHYNSLRCTYNLSSFYNEMFLVIYNQLYRQFNRLYNTINSKKSNLIHALSFDSHPIFEILIQKVKYSNYPTISSEQYFSILFETFITSLLGNDNLSSILSTLKTDNNNKFIFEDNCYIIDSKWYTNEDIFHIDSLINEHCSSSDICSSENEEEL